MIYPVQQDKKWEKTKSWEKRKLSLFANDMFVHLEMSISGLSKEYG